MSVADLDLLHPVFVVAVAAVALASTSVLARVFGAPAVSQRFEAIDGLRGFLALGVFAQHAAVWYHYSRTGQWDLPPSHLFRHLGQTSVGLFFMITALLFTRKVMRGTRPGAAGPVDWAGLYLGRVLRLWPLYLTVVAVTLATVVAVGGARLREPLGDLAQHLVSWLAFAYNGSPDVNGFADTEKIVAGVTWTLPYEWLFYLALPMLAVATRRQFHKLLAPASLVACVFLAQAIDEFHLTKLAFFAGGVVAAYWVESSRLRELARGPAGTVAVLGSLVLTVHFFATAYVLPVALLLTIGFIPLVCGNSLGGLLTLRSARLLGELTYGLYLWHGVALFFVFRQLGSVTETLSPAEHWGVTLLLTPALIVWCYLTYRCIERPFIAWAPALLRWARRPRGRGDTVTASA